MNNIIVYFLPSIIGLSLYLQMNEKTDIFNKVRIYMLFVLISNYFCIIFDYIINKFQYNLTEYIENNLGFAIKYITLLIIVNIILAFIYTIIKKYINISVEVKHERKNK